MTLEQLRIFAAVAEALSMTRAAEKLHLTQPAVSAAVAALEERYATRLFDRVGRRLELTEAGKLFLPEAVAVLARAGGARRILDDLSGLVRGEVRIAASQTVATHWLPHRMARFAAERPAIHLSLFVGNTAQAAAKVLQGDADVAFVEGEIIEDLLSARIIGGDRIGLFVAADHPLAQRRPTRQDLEAAAWVMREPGSGTRDHLESELVRSGLDPSRLSVVLELPANEAALEAVEGSPFITGVSELAAAWRQQGGTVRRLDWPLAPRDFRMLTHRSRTVSRAVSAFMAIAQ